MSSQPRYLSLDRRPARSLGHRVLNTLSLSPAYKYVASSRQYIAAKDILDVAGHAVEMRLSGLLAEPAVSMVVLSISLNGNVFKLEHYSNLRLCVSPNHLYIYFTYKDAFIEGSLVSREEHLRQFFFGLSARSVFLTLQSGGYVYAKHMLNDKPLFDFFRTQRHWGVSPVPRVENAEFLAVMDDIDRKKTEASKALELSQKETESPQSISQSLTLDKEGRLVQKKDKGLAQNNNAGFSEDKDEPGFEKDGLEASELIASQTSDSLLANLNALRGRQTRSSTKPSTSEVAEISCNDVELMPEYETPAPFDPPLKHQIGANQTFVISHSDFKTLYNNNWINDSLIDFFIAYEIHNAEKTRSETPIYALNSFFFTKLMLRPPSAPEIEPDYYRNIKRWLSKLDLTAYPYVVMPINENLHWYCCIIKGLPTLLKSAQERKARHQEEEEEEEEDEEEDDDDEGEANKTKETIEAESGLLDLGTASPDVSLTGIVSSQSSQTIVKEPLRLAKSPAKQKKSKVEIFVFDSLNQKHYNIHFPLKKFIMDYIKDKYDLEVQKNEIRVKSGYVPKQNNFNDCGIHVIYNVRRWLSDPVECERVWHAHSKYSARKFFLPQERNRMRKDFIALLLDLHDQQQKDPKSSTEEANSDHSDGDVEVIEYQPESAKEELHTTVPPAANSVKENEENEHNEDVRRTLDPKLISNEDGDVSRTESNTKLPAPNITNASLRALFGDKALKEHTVGVLNDLFGDSSKEIKSEGAAMVLSLATEVNTLDAKADNAAIKDLITLFMYQYGRLKVSSRPRDSTLVIKHYDDSSEDLQRSVRNLKISAENDQVDVEETFSKDITAESSQKKHDTITEKHEVIDTETESDPETKESSTEPEIKEVTTELETRKIPTEPETEISTEPEVDNVSKQSKIIRGSVEPEMGKVSLEPDDSESDGFVVIGEALISRKRNREQKTSTPVSAVEELKSAVSQVSEHKNKHLKVEDIEKTTQASLKKFLKGASEESIPTPEVRLYKDSLVATGIPLDSKDDSQLQSDSGGSIQEIKRPVVRSRKSSPASHPSKLSIKEQNGIFGSKSYLEKQNKDESDSDEVSMSKVVYVKRNSGMRKDDKEDVNSRSRGKRSSFNKSETLRTTPDVILSPSKDSVKGLRPKKAGFPGDLGNHTAVKYTGRVSMPLKHPKPSQAVPSSQGPNVSILVDISSEEEVEVVSSDDDIPRITAVKAVDDSRSTRLHRKSVHKGYSGEGRARGPERRHDLRVGVPQDAILELMRSPVGKIKRRRLNGN